jgi:5'-3' exonuclease
MEDDNIALIDADSICYFCSKDTLEESKGLVDELIKTILYNTKVSKCILFISEGKYFRHSIYPQYKAGRKPSTTLLFLRELKLYLKERYNAYSFSGVEADDLVSYYKQKMPKAIICSADKDVFLQIPGTHYNYKKHEFITTSSVDAYYFLWFQCIMGDSTDNIKGVPGIGEKKAEKYLQGEEDYQLRTYQAYFDYYKNSHLAMHYMQLNFKLVYLLKYEEDFKLYFEELPKITKICSL